MLLKIETRHRALLLGSLPPIFGQRSNGCAAVSIQLNFQRNRLIGVELIQGPSFLQHFTVSISHHSYHKQTTATDAEFAVMCACWLCRRRSVMLFAFALDTLDDEIHFNANNSRLDTIFSSQKKNERKKFFLNKFHSLFFSSLYWLLSFSSSSCAFLVLCIEARREMSNKFFRVFHLPSSLLSSRLDFQIVIHDRRDEW